MGLNEEESASKDQILSVKRAIAFVLLYKYILLCISFAFLHFFSFVKSVDIVYKHVLHIKMLSIEVSCIISITTIRY